jgi:probable F420-dependent oxidoreductase
VQLDAFGAGGTLKAVQKTAHQVEDAGFSALWIPEGPRPVYSVCTAAALASESLTLATGVAVAFARSPMVSAQAAWMLSEATGGRFVLGLGTQVRAHVERRFSASFEHPGPRMKEYVAAIRAIFRAFRGEERLSFSGDYYSLSLLPREWSPGPTPYPDPPIYLAGVKPWMCRMIGEVADGMLVHPLHSVAYLDDLVRPAVAEGAKRAGRAPEDIALVCPVMTAVGDDEDDRTRQREQLRQRLAFYGSTPGYGVVFEASGWPGIGERLVQLQRAKDLAALSATITDDMIDAFAVTATWDELPRVLAERYAGRIQRLVCYSAVSQWSQAPESRMRWATAAHKFQELVGD